MAQSSDGSIAVLGIVFPAPGVRLRGFALGEHGLPQGESTERIAGESAGEVLAGKVGRTAEGVPDSDVARPIHRGARQPPIEPVRPVGALLIQREAAPGIEPELVPAYPAATGRRVHGVRRDDGLLGADPPVHDARHQLVALRVEASLGARLRHAAREPPVAEVVVGCHGHLHRAGERRLRRVVPVDVEGPCKEAIVPHDLPELRAAGGEDDVRRAGWRKLPAVEIGVVEKVHAVDDDALLGRRLAAEHLRAIDDAILLLHDVVAGARGHVVPVGPHRWPRVVGKEGPDEIVSIVGAKGIGADTQRVAHAVGSPLGRGSRARAGSAISRGHGGGNGRWRLVQTSGGARLPGMSDLAVPRRFAGAARRQFMVAQRRSGEARHHDQPAIGELVIPHHGVAVGPRLARTAEAAEDIVRRDRLKGATRLTDAAAPLRADRHSRVDDLHDVVGPDRE